MRISGIAVVSVNVRAWNGSAWVSLPLTGGGIPINARAWDGSAWQDLQVESSTNKNLRAAIYAGANLASVEALNADAIAATRIGLTTGSYIHAFNGTTWSRVRCDPSKGLIVNIGGLANLAVGQVAMSATAAVIKAANTSRKALTIKNIGANPVDLGPSGVTYGTGFRLAAGEALSDIRTTAAIYGICGAGLTSTVCYWEE